MSSVATSDGCPEAMIADLLMLKVYCSSDLRGNINEGALKSFTSYLSKTPPGETYQWTFVIPITQDKPTTQNGGSTSQSVSSSATLDPFLGPDCCVTLPVHSTGGIGWPYRVIETAPTVYTELILYGTSIADSMRSDLERNVAEAVRQYLCPKGQRVWVSVIFRQVADCYTCGVMKD